MVSLILAMVQMRVDGGEVEANLARASARVAEAAANGADLVLLPEALDCGWTHPSAREAAGTIPDGPTYQHFSNLANEHGVHLGVGMIERAGEVLYNAAVFFDASGQCLMHHRKRNELDFAQKLYRQGRQMSVCETRWGKVGMMICADGFADRLHVSHELGREGCRLILSPCAWAVPADHDQRREPYGQLWLDSYQPICCQYGLYIAGVSNVGILSEGDWKGWYCIGCSFLIGPQGEILRQGSYGATAEEILYAPVSF